MLYFLGVIAFITGLVLSRSRQLGGVRIIVETVSAVLILGGMFLLVQASAGGPVLYPFTWGWVLLLFGGWLRSGRYVDRFVRQMQRASGAAAIACGLGYLLVAAMRLFATV